MTIEQQIRREAERRRKNIGTSGIAVEDLVAGGYSVGGTIMDALQGRRSFGIEVSDELLRQARHALGGMESAPHMVMIPPAALYGPMASLTTASGGDGILRPASVLPVAPAPGPNSVVVRRGATLLLDSPSGVKLRRFEDAANIGFIDPEVPDEQMDADPSTAAETIDIKQGWVSTAFSRQIDVQVPELRMLLERDLRLSADRLLDLAALAGSGTSGQPEGLFTRGDIMGVPAPGGTVTWDLLCQMEQTAAEYGSMPGWVTRTAIRRLLRKLPELASGTGRPSWRDGRLLGYPADVSGHVPEGGLLFSSDWRQLVVQVLAVRALLDPYTLAGRGIVRIRLFVFGGIGVIDPTCFATMVGLTEPELDS